MIHAIKPAPDFKYSPSAEYRFWLYDPEGNGMAYYWSKEKRDADANEAIQNYLDESWSYEVESVCAGEVTHVAQVLDKQMLPRMILMKMDAMKRDITGEMWRGAEITR